MGRSWSRRGRGIAAVAAIIATAVAAAAGVFHHAVGVGRTAKLLAGEACPPALTAAMMVPGWLVIAATCTAGSETGVERVAAIRCRLNGDPAAQAPPEAALARVSLIAAGRRDRSRGREWHGRHGAERLNATSEVVTAGAGIATATVV